MPTNRGTPGRNNGRNADGNPSSSEGKGGVGNERVDETLEALSSRYRRDILRYLKNHDVVEVAEFARYLTATQKGISPDAVSKRERQLVAVALVHTHLPKLEDGRFIEYDRRSGMVRYTEPHPLLQEIVSIPEQFEQFSTD